MWAAERRAPTREHARAKESDKGEGKSKGKGHTKDQEGKQICVAWSRMGCGPCGKADASASCPPGRARICEFCRSANRRGIDCPKSLG